MSNGNRGGSHDAHEPSRPEAPRESSSAPSEREPAREQRNEQAPLDLPPPPATKPFVVWSSSPTDAAPGTRRDE